MIGHDTNGKHGDVIRWTLRGLEKNGFLKSVISDAKAFPDWVW